MTDKEKDKLEKLAIAIQKECEKEGEPITWAESLEMAEMELKAKTDCKRYETSSKERKPANRTKQIDNEKLRLIELFNYCLLEPFVVDDNLPFKIENVSIVNNQKEIVFNVGENDYSITLTKHRKNKKGA